MNSKKNSKEEQLQLKIKDELRWQIRKKNSLNNLGGSSLKNMNLTKINGCNLNQSSTDLFTEYSINLN